MEVKEMTLIEFLTEIERTPSSQFVFKGTAWAWIYSFYKNNPQTFSYKIKVDEGRAVPPEIDRSKELLQQYGIHLGEVEEGTSFSREFVLILSEEDAATEESIRERLKELGTSLSEIKGFRNPKVTAVLVERNYSEIGLGIEWNGLMDRLNKVFSDPVNLCNDSAYSVKTHARIFDGNVLQQYKEQYGNQFNYKNLFYVLKQSNYTDRATSDESRYGMLRWAFEELGRVVEETLRETSNTIFYYTPEEMNTPRIFNTVYLEFVAFWVATHKNNPFVVETSGLNDFYRFLNAFRNKKFMYCNEWVDSLVHPLDFGLFTKANSTDVDLLCTRNVNEKCKDLVKLSLVFVNFNLETRKISGSMVFRESVTVSEIQPLAIQQLYHLDEPDKEKALANLAELNGLISRLEKVLFPNGYNLDTVIDDLLTCSNVLLFQYKGRVYLGTVASVKASYTYYVQPVLRGSQIFRYQFSVEELDHLFPLSVFADAGSVLRILPRIDLLQQAEELVTSYNMERPYLKGFVLMEVPSMNKAKLIEPNFTLEELGIWSPQTQELRVIVDSGLLGWLPAASARQCSLLTYYGGPHPLHSTDFVITEEIFRR